MQDLILAADRLAEATIEEMNRRQFGRKINEAVIKSLPENPERGSYYWWAHLCRQYTGSHFLDSGGAYGYHYQRGVRDEEGPHLTFQLVDTKLEYPSINLVGFLHTMFEADNEMADDIEQVLFWVSTWLFPREDWGKCVRGFIENLDLLYSCIQKQKGGRIVFRKKGHLDYIVQQRHRGMDTYDLMEYQRKMSEEKYVSEALKEFPVESIKRMYDAEVSLDADERGFYTYNHDNDLDQDFVVEAWLEDGYDEYAIIRTHNGCDARGGFSSPVVAAAKDKSYAYDWQAQGWCGECDLDYESYRWENKKDLHEEPEYPFDKMRAYFQIHDEIAAGQMYFEDPPGWKFDIKEDEARAIMAYLEQDEDNEIPYTLLEVDGKVMIPDDGYITVPDILIRGFWCPQCNRYTMRFYASGAHGF